MGFSDSHNPSRCSLSKTHTTVKKNKNKEIRVGTTFDSSTQILHQEHHDSHLPATASQHHWFPVTAVASSAPNQTQTTNTLSNPGSPSKEPILSFTLRHCQQPNISKPFLHKHHHKTHLSPAPKPINPTLSSSKPSDPHITSKPYRPISISLSVQSTIHSSVAPLATTAAVFLSWPAQEPDTSNPNSTTSSHKEVSSHQSKEIKKETKKEQFDVYGVFCLAGLLNRRVLSMCVSIQWSQLVCGWTTRATCGPIFFLRCSAVFFFSFQIEDQFQSPNKYLLLMKALNCRAC